MQDKVLEILAGAPGWLTASDIAEKGKFRSVANVGLCLKNLGDRVASRKSPARKNQSTGQPLVEWKHADKMFDGEACGEQKSKSETQAPLPVTGETQDDPITRRAQVRKAEPVFTQPSHDNEVAGLRAKVAELEKDVHRHSSGWQEASSRIIRFLIATQQITGMEHKPANMQEAEQQIAATIRLMQGRVEELEQTIHEMELTGAQSADAVDVKDAAVGYLVRVPKRKPRLCMKPESAREAALSGARVYGRADVLALVPVGKAVRGAEWKDAEAA